MSAKRILKITSLTLLGVAAGATATLFFLSSTTPGLRGLVRMANYALEGFTVEAVEGNLLGANFKNIRLILPGVHLQIENLRYDAKPLAFGLKGLDLNDVKLANTRITFIQPDARKDKPLQLDVREVTLKALARWVDTVTWRASLQTEGVASDNLIPFTTFNVGGDIDLEGELKGADYRAVVKKIDYAGRVNKATLQATGSLSAFSDGWMDVKAFKLNVGGNEVRLAGRVNTLKTPYGDLTAHLNAPDFSTVVEAMQGQATATVTLAGSEAAPSVTGKGTLADFSFAGTRINRASFNATLGELADDLQLNARLAIAGIKSGEAKINEGTIQASGTLSNHRVTLDFTGKPIAGRALLTGNLNPAKTLWEGELHKADFVTPMGEVGLQNQLKLTLDQLARRFMVDKHSWNQKTKNGARLAVIEPIDVPLDGSRAFAVKVSWAVPDLSIVNPATDGAMALEGALSGEVNVTVPEGWGLPQGEMRMDSDGIVMHYLLTQSEVPVTLRDIKLFAKMVPDRMTTTFNARVMQEGRVSANVSILQPADARALQGNISVDQVSLKMLEAFLDREDRARGMLKADLQLAGTTEKPQLFGDVDLTGLLVDSVMNPLKMRESEMHVKFAGMASTLDARIRTQTGDVTLKGSAQFNDEKALNARVRLSSDKTRVTLPPQVALDLTSDVTCEVTPDLIHLEGIIDVPWARVKVKDVPASAVDLSKDVVRLDQPRKERQSVKAVPIESDLYIKIGDDVSVDAMGLKANLTGRLKVVQDREQLGLTGQVTVPEGQFRAYGQALDIRKGEFRFAGPVANPQIDLEAIRAPEKTADNVIAGIRVTGNAEAPKVTVFSEPAMGESEALSYLATGRGFDSSSENSNAVAQALLGLGVSQGSAVLGAIGDSIGIRDLALDTEGTGEDSQVAVSAYILPGLKVKYGVGLFDSLATLTLRYQVMPKLYLEAVSGVDQALDVIYQFDFDELW